MIKLIDTTGRQVGLYWPSNEAAMTFAEVWLIDDYQQKSKAIRCLFKDNPLPMSLNLNESWINHAIDSYERAGQVNLIDSVKTIPAAHELPDNQLLHTVAQVSEIFHVTPRTLYNWVNSGRIKPTLATRRQGVKMLFPQREIDKLLATD